MADRSHSSRLRASLPGFSRHPLFGLFQLAIGIALLALLIMGKFGGC